MSMAYRKKSLNILLSVESLNTFIREENDT